MNEELELIEGDDFTEVDQYDPKVKAKAYDTYLNTSLGPTEIAIDLGVPARVVSLWIRRGKWNERKKEVELELFRSAEDKYRRVILEHRVPTVERHLRIAKKLEEGIEQVIDAETNNGGVPDAVTLRRMSEALASATGVSARAAAISDKPFTENAEEARKGKVPLVTINVTPVVHRGKEEKFIDVS